MKTRVQTAVITGASSGIGKAVALELAGEGTTLYLLGRDRERLEEVARSAEDLGASAICHAFDLGDDRHLRDFAATVESRPLDVLVHSAGVAKLGTVAAAPVEDFDLHYRINLRAPFVLTQLLLPMLSASRGQIVFINSGAGLNARGSWSQYAASKHALKALADSLRAEVGTRGLRVLSVYPGRTASPMQAEVRKMEGEPYRPESLIQAEDVASQVGAALGLPETATVTDLVIRPAGG